MSRSRPTRSVISSHCLPLRWSHQMMERRNTLPALSSITRPCICPERPTPFMSAGSTRLSLITCSMVAAAALHQSPGSCSAQPFSG